MALNKNQLRFAREYLKNGFNAYQAAIKAGYSKAYAKNATKNLVENSGIQEYIKKRTKKVEQQADSEVDEVLANIFNIGAGRNIERRYRTRDNLIDEITEDSTITGPANFKEQVSAGELWLKVKGTLRNDSKEIENAKVRKIQAEATIKEAEAKIMNGEGAEIPDDGFLKALKQNADEVWSDDNEDETKD